MKEPLLGPLHSPAPPVAAERAARVGDYLLLAAFLLTAIACALGAHIVARGPPERAEWQQFVVAVVGSVSMSVLAMSAFAVRDHYITHNPSTPWPLPTPSSPPSPPSSKPPCSP